MGSLAAVFFDMDGLLVDTEPIWTIAEHEAAARLGGEFTPAMKRAMIGHGIDTAVPLMVSMLGRPESDVPATARFLLHRSAELFREPGVIVAQPGAVELLDALRAAGVPLALVSSSFRDLMDPVLRVIGTGYFAVTVAGDEVTRRKPDPEPYLTAARMLGVDPRTAVVLEDSPSGAQAGVAAGCVTVMIPSMPELLDPAATTTATATATTTAAGGPGPGRGPDLDAVPRPGHGADDVGHTTAGAAPAAPAAGDTTIVTMPAGLAAVLPSLHDVDVARLDTLVTRRLPARTNAPG